MLRRAVMRQGGGASGMEDQSTQAAREATELAEPAAGEREALLGKGSRPALMPQKSATGLVSIGPDYPAQQVGSVCHA